MHRSVSAHPQSGFSELTTIRIVQVHVVKKEFITDPVYPFVVVLGLWLTHGAKIQVGIRPGQGYHDRFLFWSTRKV